MTVTSHRVESLKNPLQRYVGEEWVAVDNEKPQFFLNTLYEKLIYLSNLYIMSIGVNRTYLRCTETI